MAAGYTGPHRRSFECDMGVGQNPGICENPQSISKKQVLFIPTKLAEVGYLLGQQGKKGGTSWHCSCFALYLDRPLGPGNPSPATLSAATIQIARDWVGVLLDSCDVVLFFISLALGAKNDKKKQEK